MGDFTAGGKPSAGSALLGGFEQAFPGLAPIVGEIGATLTGAQSFNTISVTNTKIALYTLSIRSPSAPYLPYITYTFPLSPQSVRKRFTAMSNIFDVAGDSSVGGVQRLLDEYGNSPVTFFIEGTTGWKLHSTDGYSLTGLESIKALQNVLSLYAQLNAIQAVTNQPPYTLEFYDYFNEDFWQVSPIGDQEFSQSAARPLLTNYSFRLAGIKSLNSPINEVLDAINKLINNPIQQVLSFTGQFVGNVLSNYISNTPGAASLPGISTLLSGL